MPIWRQRVALLVMFYGPLVPSAGGVTGPLAAVFYAVAIDHVLKYVRDIVGAG